MSALGQDPKPSDIKRVMAKFDKDGSNTIDFAEFLDIMVEKYKQREPREEMEKSFKLFCDDDSGKITFNQLKKVCKELGEAMSDSDIQEMIDEADLDGDNKISVDEYCRVMRKTNLFQF